MLGPDKHEANLAAKMAERRSRCGEVRRRQTEARALKPKFG
jgi:hypothetical protein